MIRYYLNGVEANPKQSEKIRFSLDFSLRDVGEIIMSVTNIVFVREDYEACNTWLNTYGYTVGMPFDVRFANGQERRYILDWMDGSFSQTNEHIKVNAIARGQSESFFPKADGLTFTNSTLLSWSESDFVKINFLVIPPDQITLLITTSIMTLMLAKELAEGIERAGDTSNAVIKSATPVGLPPAPDWGAMIIVVIKAALTIAYTIAIIITFINLVV
jgi:hypothetical protein